MQSVKFSVVKFVLFWLIAFIYTVISQLKPLSKLFPHCAGSVDRIRLQFLNLVCPFCHKVFWCLSRHVALEFFISLLM